MVLVVKSQAEKHEGMTCRAKCCARHGGICFLLGSMKQTDERQLRATDRVNKAGRGPTCREHTKAWGGCVQDLSYTCSMVSHTSPLG